MLDFLNRIRKLLIFFNWQLYHKLDIVLISSNNSFKGFKVKALVL